MSLGRLCLATFPTQVALSSFVFYIWGAEVQGYLPPAWVFPQVYACRGLAPPSVFSVLPIEIESQVSSLGSGSWTPKHRQSAKPPAS